MTRGQQSDNNTSNDDPDGREPHHRQLHMSTKENSEFKWKHDKTVIGALEIRSDPILDLRAKMVEHDIKSYEDEFKQCLELWEKYKLRNQFIEAWENLPPQTRCCGYVNDYDNTIKKNVPTLNNTWVKKVNDEKFAKEGFRISLFVWSWSNVTGKAETVIPMIRFHSLSIKRFD
jgi:hypothetical protein